MNTTLYRYVGCGLPNVFLENGYTLEETPYGEGVTIHDLEGLHLAIGAAVVENPAPLTGPEFRFLRHELELSQAALGALIGRDEQSVARWEKEKSRKGIDRMADRLIRLIFQNAKTGSKSFAPALEILQKLDSTPPAPKNIRAKEVDRGWDAQPCAECA